jgi:hypothetical protein
MAETPEIRRLRRGATAAFVILLLGLVFVRYEDINEAEKINAAADKSREAVVHSTTVISTQNCNEDFRRGVEVLSVLEGSRKFARRQYEDGKIDKSTFEIGDTFYRERIEGLPLPDCRKVAKTISSSNADKQPIPEALYPGSRLTKGDDNAGDGGQDPGARPAPGGGGG